jgi:hypothetical protein
MPAWILEGCLAVGCVIAYVIAAIRWWQLVPRGDSK